MWSRIYLSIVLVLGTCSNFAAERAQINVRLKPFLYLYCRAPEQIQLEFNVEIFTLFYVKMIQVWTFPADLSTEYIKLTCDYLTGEYQH